MITRRPWLLTYTNQKTRIIWSEFREVLSCGTVAFYNTDPTKEGAEYARATEHLYVVAAGFWQDVIVNPKTLSGDLETIGIPQ